MHNLQFQLDMYNNMNFICVYLYICPISYKMLNKGTTIMMYTDMGILYCELDRHMEYYTPFYTYITLVMYTLIGL